MEASILSALSLGFDPLRTEGGVLGGVEEELSVNAVGTIQTPYFLYLQYMHSPPANEHGHFVLGAVFRETDPFLHDHVHFLLEIVRVALFEGKVGWGGALNGA